MGKRINHRGQVLDRTPIIVCGETGFQRTPSVCFGDTNFLVVWTDERPGNIYGARVSQTGVVLDPGGIRIALTGSGNFPSVSFDGNNYLVVWFGENKVRGARVNQGGVVLDTVPINIASNYATRWHFQTLHLME